MSITTMAVTTMTTMTAMTMASMSAMAMSPMPTMPMTPVTSVTVDRFSLIGDVCDIAAVPVGHLVVDVLGPAVGQGHAVVAVGRVAVTLLLLPEVGAVVVVVHPVLIGVVGWLIVVPVTLVVTASMTAVTAVSSMAATVAAVTTVTTEAAMPSSKSSSEASMSSVASVTVSSSSSGVSNGDTAGQNEDQNTNLRKKM